MVRTQVQFTEEEVQALRAIAAAEGVSVSSVVRQAVDHMVNGRRRVSREELWRRADEVCGAFRSGTDDLAERHDDYFAEAAAE